MTSSASERRGDQALGPALRRAWLGYQQRLDEEMTAAGFADRGFPNGRVLRFCAATPGTTIASIGRELGVSRQRASQVVRALQDGGYVTVSPSPSSAKEKVVAPTPRGTAYLAAHRQAARRIERQVAAELGPGPIDALWQLLGAFGTGDTIRMRDYLRQKRQDGGLRYPEE
jgi:DNA-binding MarR family transcriptional regulator